MPFLEKIKFLEYSTVLGMLQRMLCIKLCQYFCQSLFSISLQFKCKNFFHAENVFCSFIQIVTFKYIAFLCALFYT